MKIEIIQSNDIRRRKYKAVINIELAFLRIQHQNMNSRMLQLLLLHLYFLQFDKVNFIEAR